MSMNRTWAISRQGVELGSLASVTLGSLGAEDAASGAHLRLGSEASQRTVATHVVGVVGPGEEAARCKAGVSPPYSYYTYYKRRRQPLNESIEIVPKPLVRVSGVEKGSKRGT